MPQPTENTRGLKSITRLMKYYIKQRYSELNTHDRYGVEWDILTGRESELKCLNSFINKLEGKLNVR